MSETKQKKKFNFKTFFLSTWIFVVGIFYLILLPPINPSSFGFWSFFLPALFIPLFVITQVVSLKDGLNKGKSLWPIYLVIICFVVYFLGSVIFSPMANAKLYTNRITITNQDFESGIQPVDFDNLPLLDKDSSQKVGNRIVGQIPELVSQFSVSDEYSLINYKGEIVRVTPLEHNGFIKYLSNLSGTAGYIIVDTTTGDSKLVRTESGLKYLPSAYFFHDLYRHARLSYPFDCFGEVSFEVDEQGIPYWVIQTIDYTWVGLKPKVSGVVIINAIDGSSEKYSVNEVPTWIDNVYDARLVIEELDDWGKYQNGYFNSIFAQKNCVVTTDGYTYITKGDDVYMYTGITSIASDESNIGFVMVNLRTHQADFYSVPGAEEYSAMDSARGVVQEKGYTSTFPLLINLNGEPTYLLSLKDSAGLVKMYAFVDVVNYQKVSVTDASLGIKKAAENYLKVYGEVIIVDHDTETTTIEVSNVAIVVIDGNTYYYLLDSNNSVFSIKATVDLSITPFIKNGDNYEVTYFTENNIKVVNEIKKVAAPVVNTPVETTETE